MIEGFLRYFTVRAARVDGITLASRQEGTMLFPDLELESLTLVDLAVV